MADIGELPRSVLGGCAVALLLFVVPSRDAEGAPPPFVCAQPDAGSQAIHIEFDAGGCSTLVKCFVEGCRSGGECETRRTDAGYESFDSFGEQFIECGETFRPCGREVRCACPNAPKTRR